MTSTCTRQEGQVAIFIAVDHCSAEGVGIHAAKQGTRFEALEPIRQGVRTACGAFAHDVARGLVLRHDYGSQYMSHGFQEELRFLGIASSPAFVREPEGNGCAERFIRTLKEKLLWLQTFETVEELRLALHGF
jgi:putative transposase